MQLSEWLARADITRTEFARRIGVSRSHITGLCSGANLPSLPVAWDIERETAGQVTPADWQKSETVPEAAE